MAGKALEERAHAVAFEDHIGPPSAFEEVPELQTRWSRANHDVVKRCVRQSPDKSHRRVRPHDFHPGREASSGPWLTHGSIDRARAAKTRQTGHMALTYNYEYF